MPSIKAPATVLVTGANGFISLYVVKHLLEQGFKVKGQVRSIEKGETIKPHIKEYLDNFEVVVIKDIAKPGAFDEAFKGVDAVAHIAAPLPKMTGSPDEVMQPAVQGTIAILDSAKKSGTIKRVIVTSTVYAAVPEKDSPHHYTEDDWNDAAVEAFNSLGSDSPPAVTYIASKVITERIAFDYVKNNDVNFDVVSILPTTVTGPPLNEISSTELDVRFGSTAILWNGIKDRSLVPEFVDPSSYIDVRDCADTYINALLRDEVAGERFLSLAGPFGWQRTFDALRNAGYVKVAVDGKDAIQKHTYNNTKSERLLGIKYISLESSMVDTMAEFVNRGWFNKDGSSLA